MQERDQARETFSVHDEHSSPKRAAARSIGPSWRMRVRQVEFPSTVEADLVGAVFDREHAAQVTVPAAKDKLENTQATVS